MQKFSLVFACLAFVAGATLAQASPQWNFSKGDVASQLNYSDAGHTSFGLFCSSGFGMLGAYAEIPGIAADEARDVAIDVQAGGQAFSFQGGIVQQGVQWMMAADDGLFPAMAKGGDLVISADGKSLSLPLAGADLQSLNAACGGM